MKHMVNDGKQTWFVTGARMDILATAAMLTPGAKVKVVFMGVKSSEDGERTWKEYELYVQDR